MRHYDLTNGQPPEGSSKLTVSFEENPVEAKLYLDSNFPEHLTIFGEISLFCSYAYHQREYYVMMDRLASKASETLEQILTGPPIVDANGRWRVRGNPASGIVGKIAVIETQDETASNRFTIDHRYFATEISADMFPVESSLHRSIARQPGSTVNGELASISIEVEGFGFRHRHEDEYALQSVAHLFAFLLMRHPDDQLFDEVLCRAALYCLFPSVLNAQSAREDQQYFAAIAAKHAFTGQTLPNV